MQYRVLAEKLKEAAASVLPVTAIVAVLCLALVRVDVGLMLSFLLGSGLLIVGMGLFTLGAELSMSRIGNLIGAKMTKSQKLWFVLGVSFLLGVAITMAEPDLQVLATNVPAIDKTVLVVTVSVGVGFFLMLCMARILFSISLRLLLIIFYAIVFIGAFLSDAGFLSVAFDSGGVTTGPMTVPFIMALGVGVASIRSDENAKADSFGLVALCSIGPVLAVMLLGAIYPTDTQADVSMIIGGFETSVDLGFAYLHSLPDYLLEVAMALLPIFVFFLLFQVFSLHLRRLPLTRIVMGVGYTFLGLVLFLTGVNVGFLAAWLRARKRARLERAIRAAHSAGDAHGLVHHRRGARRTYFKQAGRRIDLGRDLGKGDGAESVRCCGACERACDGARSDGAADSLFSSTGLRCGLGAQLLRSAHIYGHRV